MAKGIIITFQCLSLLHFDQDAKRTEVLWNIFYQLTFIHTFFLIGRRLLGQVMQHGDTTEGGSESNPVSDTLQCDQPTTMGVFYA